MPTSLVTYVGSSDPFGAQGAPGPILSILEHLDAMGQLPDRVVLIVTKTHRREFALADGGLAECKQEGMEEKARPTAEEIEKRYNHRVKVDPVDICVNPADLDEVIEETLQTLAGHLDGEEDVHINVSSGTPSMSAAITFLVDSGHIRRCQVWQSLNPDKLPPGAVRVKRVTLAYLSERDRLDRALTLLRAMAFSHAGEQFSVISARTLIPQRRPRAEAASSLMQVYASWDRGDYENAWTRLKRVKAELKQLGGGDSVPQLARQEMALHEVMEDRKSGRERYKEPVETKAILEDLHAGLLRRSRANQSLSIPTRARRMYEGLVNYLLYQAGLNPRDRITLEDPPLAALSERARRVVNYLLQRAPRLDLPARLELISVLAEEERISVDPKVPKGVEDAYQRFGDVRNRSIDEHGLSGVTEDAAQVALQAATDMMNLVFPGFAEASRNHPFGPEALDEVAEGIEAWFSA